MTAEAQPSDASDRAAGTSVVVAGPGREFRVRWAVVGMLAIAMGGWFAYDGWVKYPAETARYRAIDAQLRDAEARNDEPAIRELRAERGELKEHSASDIAIQRGLAVGAPLLGVALLAHMLYHSRGAYRLTDAALHVPGQPPIPRSTVRSIDLARWARKGVAVVTHDRGRATLDEWHHAHRPTREIVRRLCAQLGTPYPDDATEPQHAGQPPRP